jgi:DNA polymerase III subunit alpha
LKYVNLHHHSTFSFGDGFGTPAQHVARAAELGYEAIALTEHGNVSSHFQLEKAAIKAGIKPIFGIEAYCGSVREEDGWGGTEESPVFLPGRQQFKNHLTILASSPAGYRSLNRIVTQSYLDYYYHPTISGASLANNSDGLFVLSGCSGSLLACTLLGGKGIAEPEGGPDYSSAMAVIERFQHTFGDAYFIEVQPFFELPRTIAMNTAYERLSRATSVPMVVTCDVHYPRPEDGEMQAVLHAVHRGNASVDDQMREWNYEVPLTLPNGSPDEFLARVMKTGLSKGAAMDAIYMGWEIANMCDVTLPKAARLEYPITKEDLNPWT